MGTTHMAQLNLSDRLMQRLEAQAAAQGVTVETLLTAALETPPAAPTSPALIDDHGVEALNLIADAVITTDSARRIIRFNQGAESVFGYREAEVRGQMVDVLLPDPLIKQHAQHMNRFAASPDASRHMAHRMPVSGKRKNGEIFPAEASILKCQLSGQPCFVAILRDVSQQAAMLTRLAESDQLLRLLTENATDMICLHEPDGRFVFLSPASRVVNGYEPEELIGKNPYDFFHPDDLTQIIQSHQTSLTGQPVPYIIYRVRRKDGRYVWVETLTNPVIDANGKVTHLVTVTRDITERQRMETMLRQERDLLSQIMATSPSGITVVDRDGQIIFANQRAEDIHGICRDEIRGRAYNAPDWRITDYDGNPWPEENLPFAQVMRTRQPVWDVRHAIEWPDGRRVYLVINGAPIFDERGEVSKVVFTVEDDTQRKLQQDQLKAALAREKQMNELKSAFINMVTHEFRTPMTTIMTSTGILRRRRQALSPAEFEARLDKIDTQIRRLSRLLADITFLSKDELVGHVIDPVTIHLSQFFAQLADEVLMIYPDHTALCVEGTGVCDTVQLDLSLMEQIFENLLNNAVKYSPADRPVLCRYTCDQDTLHVLIKDEGIGIPYADQPLIFQAFQRGSNVNGIQGTGLGLNIVKRAVDTLGGSVSFESAPGQGTTFLVTIPLP